MDKAEAYEVARVYRTKDGWMVVESNYGNIQKLEDIFMKSQWLMKSCTLVSDIGMLMYRIANRVTRWESKKGEGNQNQ